MLRVRVVDQITLPPNPMNPITSSTSYNFVGMDRQTMANLFRSRNWSNGKNCIATWSLEQGTAMHMHKWLHKVITWSNVLNIVNCAVENSSVAEPQVTVWPGEAKTSIAQWKLSGREWVRWCSCPCLSKSWVKYSLQLPKEMKIECGTVAWLSHNVGRCNLGQRIP